jgi:uncharacterized protein
VTSFWHALAHGVTFAVKVRSGARRPGLYRTTPSANGPRSRIAVIEPPEGGCATRAAGEALANAPDGPSSAVRVLAGAAAREKRLFVGGDAAPLGRRVAAL